MRIGLVMLFAIALVVAACKPITPEESASAEQPPRTETVAATEAPDEATTGTPVDDADTTEPVAVETATVEATDTITPAQSAATAESVAPTETPTETSTAPETAPETPTTEPEPPAELVAFGYEMYRKQYCGICHTLEAAGTTGTFGPPHDQIGTIAATRILEPNYSGSATNAAEYLYESLVMPEIFIVDGYALSSHRMPAYSFLHEDELDALVAYLLAQK